MNVWTELKDKYLGEPCLIIGNGKSLAHESNEFLSMIPSFGTNRIYMKFTPSFYVCVNPLVAEQYKHEIEMLKCPKFVTDRVNIPGAIPLHSNHIMAFSRNPEEYICEGYTVTYVCMQLAYFMGFQNIYLIGVDHDYKFSGEPNQVLTATGDDPNHFDPAYFSGGHTWNAPDLAMSEKAYLMAKRVFEADHRSITNIGRDSKLEIFPKKEDLWL